MRQSFVVEMVGKDDLANAVGINSTIFNTGRILGPAVAGVMITAVGTGWAFLANAASSVAVLAALALMRPAELHPVAAGRAARSGQLREGFRYVRGRPDLVLTMVLVFVVGTFGLNFQITTALLAKQVFHRGASGYGLLSTALAVGAFAGAILATRRTKRPSQLFLIGAALAFSLLEIAAGLMPTFALTAVAARPDRAGDADLHDRGQLLGPARRRADDARTGDGAVPGVLHGRDAARRADHRLAGRRRRPAVGADRRRADLPASRRSRSAPLARRAA